MISGRYILRRLPTPQLINYTERLTLLMEDIVRRVPTLSFIDVADVLVFARSGRSNAEGAFATCHCLTLPPSERELLERHGDWIKAEVLATAIRVDGGSAEPQIAKA